VSSIHWVSRTPFLLSPDLSMNQAVCIHDVFLAQIQPLMGRPLGYKASAITPLAQRLGAQGTTRRHRRFRLQTVKMVGYPIPPVGS
jgi:hypothetical protein